MFFKGPLAKTTGGFIISVLLIAGTLTMFVYLSVHFEQRQISKMENQLSGCTKIYELLKQYSYRKIDFTQDGKIVLIDKDDKKVISFALQSAEELAVLNTVKEIYKDDDGVSFIYSNNNFAYVSKYVFTERGDKSMQGKGSSNEEITRLSNGVYEVVYRFDYTEILSPKQLKYQLEGLLSYDE